MQMKGGFQGEGLLDSCTKIMIFVFTGRDRCDGRRPVTVTDIASRRRAMQPPTKKKRGAPSTLPAFTGVESDTALVRASATESAEASLVPFPVRSSSMRPECSALTLERLANARVEESASTGVELEPVVDVDEHSDRTDHGQHLHDDRVPGTFHVQRAAAAGAGMVRVAWHGCPGEDTIEDRAR